MATMRWDERAEAWVAINPVKPVSKPSFVSVLPVSDVKSKILANPRYNYVYRLTKKLYEAHGFDFVEPAFRNRQGSYHRNGQIVYGYESINRAFENGFVEYKTVEFVWFRGGYKTRQKGFQALWQLVLHEFAHVIQGKEGSRYFGSVHNDAYCQILRDLIILFPLEEQK